MKKAIIVSLKFHPGHVSHLVASYKQCEEIGFEPVYYVAKGFSNYLPEGSNSIYEIEEILSDIDLVLLLFPNPKNLFLIHKIKARNKNVKIVYLFHEPLTSLSTYRKAGFSCIQMFKLVLVDYLEGITVKKSNVVLLPSQRALEFYTSNGHYKNKNISLLPLLYDDESIMMKEKPRREFFSYIGTIASDHSYDECVDFMLYAIKNDLLPGISFLIATRNNVDRTPRVIAAQNTGRLRIVDGKPMTNDEINYWYASSYAIWNAYTRTTQSGVLPKAFMFGTPAIVLRSNLSEFSEDKKEVYCIDDNTQKEQLIEAVNNIIINFNEYSKNCRNRFMNTYYYRSHNEEIKDLINKFNAGI